MTHHCHLPPGICGAARRVAECRVGG